VRPVVRGPAPVDETGQAVEFDDYRDAQEHLLECLGGYCSYCGMRLDSMVHVEHVRPKSLYEHLRLAWDNFLLACVHCNSSKSDEDVVLEKYSWPDSDNPMVLLEYGPGAMVRPRPGLVSADHARAAQTLELVGLDRIPGSEKPPTAKDRRWRMRDQAWEKSQRALDRLRNKDTPELREQIIESAIYDGYWAVWYAAFADDSDLRWRLIRALRGTCQTCWDDSGAPLTRSR
jgi:uncharacterized protein (TIGR02646 family)